MQPATTGNEWYRTFRQKWLLSGCHPMPIVITGRRTVRERPPAWSLPCHRARAVGLHPLNVADLLITE